MKIRGRGYACVHQGTNYHFGDRDEAEVILRVASDGDVVIESAVCELGQDAATTLALIVSEVLGGLSVDRVVLPIADSQLPEAGYSAASRQTTMAGRAVLNAAEILRDTLERLAAEMLDVDPRRLVWEAGRIVDREGKGRSVSIVEIAEFAEQIGLELSCHGHFVAPPTTPLTEDTGQGIPINQFSYGTCYAEVEVDTDTGEVCVTRLISVHDSGRIINLQGAEGQAEGGLVMGLGFALMEDFGALAGSPIKQGLSQYLIPTSMDTSDIEVVFSEGSLGFGPYGAKGLAEVPTVVAAPAIVNAIFDATGVRIADLPATPERILRGLKTV